MNISKLLLVRRRLILCTTLSSQEHRDVKLGLVTLHVTRLGQQKVDKVGLVFGSPLMYLF
jgi:hypothetical protein